MKRMLLLCLLLASEGATALDWQVGEPGVLASPTNGGFTIQPPSGWFYTSRVGVFAAAHNGALLDFIRITQTPYDRAAKNFKKPISIDTAPEELAEYYVAALQQEGMREMSVLSTEPTEVGGRPAFRMHLEYRLPEGYGGAQMEEITLGATTENGVLLAHYFGAKIHYFQASLPSAEESLRTLTFVPLTK